MNTNKICTYVNYIGTLIKCANIYTNGKMRSLLRNITF